MENKAQSTSFSQMLIGLLVIGVVGLFIFLFITKGQEIEVTVEENEILRRKMTLTNVLLSSDKLAYSDGPTVHRGVLDKQKLDDIESSPELLFSEISYPETGYSIKVVDLDENKEWLIGEDFEAVFESPVTIRYSEDDIHLGLLAVNFNKGVFGFFEIDTCQKITDLGYYKLTKNLGNDDLLGNGNCFEIKVSGITLDCDNNYIDGVDWGSGIVISKDNVVIKNCEIKKFGNGMLIESSSNTVEDNRIESTNVGIVIFKDDNIIKGNTITNPRGEYGRGIDVHSSSNTIEENTVDSAITVGIIIRKSDNILNGNEVCGSSNDDIYVEDGKTVTGGENSCDSAYNFRCDYPCP